MSNFHNACHAKCRLLSPRATTPTQNEGRCQQVPCLRRKTNMDVATCHACHTKAACHSVAARRATNRTQACGQSQPSAVSATPATQNKGRCHQSPLLPCIKPTWMSPSACPEEEENVAKCHVQGRRRRRRRARTSLVAVRCADRLWQ